MKFYIETKLENFFENVKKFGKCQIALKTIENIFTIIERTENVFYNN